MPTSTDVVEGALVAGATRVLCVGVDAMHQVVATPVTAVVEGAKTAVVFVASHVIGFAIKSGLTASWWLISTAAAAVTGTVTAGATVVYNSLFAPRQPQYALIGYRGNSAETLFQDAKETSPRAAAMDMAPPAPSAGPSLTRNMQDID